MAMWTAMANASNPPWSETCPIANDDNFFTLTAVDPMGAQRVGVNDWNSANSCNIVNAGMSAQMTMNTKIINANSSTQSNSIVINAECDNPSSSASTNGNCDKIKINNNNVTQSNLISMQGVQAAITSNEAQQSLYLSVMQSASSVTKGLALLPQTSNAANLLNMFMRASIIINTNIRQYCKTIQSNQLVINIDDYNNASLSNNIFTQNNTIDTQKCLQLAITRNKLSQQLTASISQVATAFSAGLNIILLLVVFMICFAVFSTVTIVAAAYDYVFMGLIVLAIGIVILVGGLSGYYFDTKITGAWFLGSASLSSCTSYTKSTNTEDINRSFANYNAAIDYLSDKKVKKEKYVAFDWVVPNPSNEQGFATYYNGPYGLDKCPTVTSPNSTSNWNVIGVRNPIFIQLTGLGDNPPSVDQHGDVCLSVDNGNLWFKVPVIPNDLSTAPSSDEWVKPSDLVTLAKNIPESSKDPDPLNYQDPVMQDNVFNDSNNTRISSFSTTASVYFYIPMSTTNLFGTATTTKPVNIDNTIYGYSDVYPYGSNALLSSSGYTVNNFGDNPNIKDGDYFLVPYPTGSQMDETNGTEVYIYGSVYYLYKAIKSNVKKNIPYVPYEPADSPVLPVNTINGFGIIPYFQFSTNSYILYKKRQNWYFVFVAIGAALILFGGIIALYGIANPIVPKTNTDSHDGSLPLKQGQGQSQSQNSQIK